MRRLKKFAKLSNQERREVLRRRRDYLTGLVLFGFGGALLNRSNKFAYLSYVPDSIREYQSISGFRQDVALWVTDNARRNGGDLPRMLTLSQNAERVLRDQIPGHFAELGVHKGHSARLLADILSRMDSTRRIYLYDTFEGFDSRDLRGVDAEVPRIFSDTSLALVRERVGNPGVCLYRPGYFPESTNGDELDAEFAFVHLDCDLYEPTREALHFFYPRLSAGGFVVIHDYSSGHWPGITRAVEEFLSDKPERLVLIPDKSGTALFRKH